MTQISRTDGVSPELLDMRRTIDNIDAALVHLLAERFRCTRRVGQLKAATKMAPGDPSRDAQQIARLRALAQESGLDPDFAERIHGFIVAEVIRNHQVIAAGADSGS